MLNKSSATKERLKVEKIMKEISFTYGGRPAQRPFLANVISECYRTWVDLKRLESPSLNITWKCETELKMLDDPQYITQFLGGNHSHENTSYHS